VEFCPVVVNLYPRKSASFGRFISIFVKIARVSFSMNTYRYDYYKLRVYQVELLWLYRQQWVASDTSDLNSLDYHVWGQCWNIKAKAAPKAKSNS